MVDMIGRTDRKHLKKISTNLHFATLAPLAGIM
jgi:hypothetical protein